MTCRRSKIWLTNLHEKSESKENSKEEEILYKVANYLEQQDRFTKVYDLDVVGHAGEGRSDEAKVDVVSKYDETEKENKRYREDNYEPKKEQETFDDDDLMKSLRASLKEENEEKCKKNGEQKDGNCSFYDNAEDDYDTDLECEEDPRKNYMEEQQERYINRCRRLGIPPASILLKSLVKKKLKLSHQGLGSKGIQAIAATIKTNTFITEIDLRDNNIDEAGIRVIAKVLRENLFIADLDISENMVCNAGLSELVMALKVSKTIKHLKMSQTGLRDKHAGLITDLIKDNLYIKELSLSKNEFGAAAGILFGQSITVNNKISHLDLSWNHIRNDGALAIGQALKGNTSITNLDLAWNGFADQGTEAIAKALLTNDSLKEVDLSYNRISEKGAAALADALKANGVLKVLKMNWNAVKSEGVTSLIEGINKNAQSQIEELHLNGVVINGVCKTEMDDLLIKRKLLKIYHGGVTNSGAIATNMSKIRREIVEIITKYLAKNRLRMLDLFNQWDKDKSLTLTRNEFRKGIKSCKIPITEIQLYFMLEWLDQDGNDEIEYNEFVAITEVE